jgi:hypothetical protein
MAKNNLSDSHCRIRFDLLALIVEDYERRRWPIKRPKTIGRDRTQ